MVVYNVFYNQGRLCVDLDLLDLNGNVIGGCIQVGSNLIFVG